MFVNTVYAFENNRVLNFHHIGQYVFDQVRWKGQYVFDQVWWKSVIFELQFIG